MDPAVFDMKVHCTSHAEDQMYIRNVAKEQVEATLRDPQIHYPTPSPQRAATDVRIRDVEGRSIKVYYSAPAEDEYLVHTVAVRGE